MHKVDEAIPETLVMIDAVIRCDCGCHTDGALCFMPCCRYPRWWPSAPVLAEIVDRMRFRIRLKKRLPPSERMPIDFLMYTCQRCGRAMSHTRQWGYICEYCCGIED